MSTPCSESCPDAGAHLAFYPWPARMPEVILASHRNTVKNSIMRWVGVSVRGGSGVGATAGTGSVTGSISLWNPRRQRAT